jgi:hypothetical protein
MNVISDGLNVLINIKIKMGSSLPLKTPSLNHVEQMWNNTRLNHTLTILVKVNSPRIAGSFSKYLKFMSYRVVTPYPSVNPRPF